MVGTTKTKCGCPAKLKLRLVSKVNGPATPINFYSYCSCCLVVGFSTC